VADSIHNLAGEAPGRRPADDELTYVYAYGSLLSPALMRQPCPSATFVIKAKLPNFEVQFRVPSDTGLGGTSGIVEAPGQLVRGVIYNVTKTEVLDLDVLEGVPEGKYRKGQFLVLGDDKEWYEVNLYMPAAPGDLIPPAPHYLDDMIAGAKAHGLDPEYTAKLVAWRHSLD
jgi:hypothetical protein